MPMLVVVTRDVEQRYRGFLGSVLLEISAGVYAHPRINSGVRERLWNVVEDWHNQLRQGCVVMAWADTNANGGLGLLSIGDPPKEIVKHCSMLLVRRKVS